MFITNNRALFHFSWKENLVKHQKVSKYYEPWLSAMFSFAFHIFINSTIVKNGHILAKAYFILLKKRPRLNVDLV